MLKRCILLLLTLLCMASGSSLRAQALPKSIVFGDSAYASLLTCGPGDDFYTVFGHTAIRLCDTTQGIDCVFNYGVFDFHASDFYLRFVQGDMQYMLYCYPFEDFMLEYLWEKRSVFEQRLMLSTSELNALADALMVNALPENCFYRYEFFHDNCATRARDIIERSLEHEHLSMMDSATSEPVTFRQLLHQYGGEQMSWWLLGIDMLLGSRCDKPITGYECGFLPLELMTQYDTTAVMDTGKSLSENTIQLLVDHRDQRKAPISPTLVFWLLFALTALLTALARLRGWRMGWLDATLFTLCALIGLLILYLWFGSIHWCTKSNFNILWANPLLLLLLFAKGRKGRLLSFVVLVCLAATLVLMPVHGVYFHSAVLPIVLTLMLRVMAHRRTSIKKRRNK
ncbi:MAG: DUF4105 domain-containing protein [Bacteroidales bacterium]|nr:DUF4105 domain-containing protein [Bacteroidales bacterium]